MYPGTGIPFEMASFNTSRNCCRRCMRRFSRFNYFAGIECFVVN